MCCIFTCCGWLIDLVQRLWTFAMACCISSAVCCAVGVSCMSGIALGYNYSLAEYIDLKETNVSVYLKRGVFDDEIADDMEWRRSGPHQPLAGALGENGGDLITPEVAGNEMPLRSGRRLDDSIFESNDHHRFEGSLVKLTQNPVHPSTVPVTNMNPQDILALNPMGSLNQLKEIQAMINRRKMDALERTTRREDPPRSTLEIEKQPNALINFPAPAPMGPNGRRMMLTLPTPTAFTLGGPARKQVPFDLGNNFEIPTVPIDPRMSEEQRFTMSAKDMMKTMLRPMEPRHGVHPIGVTTKTPLPWPVYTKTYPPPPRTSVRPSPAPIEKFPLDELPEEKFEIAAGNKEKIDRDFNEAFTNKPGGIIEEYEDDIKGLPVRRRRAIQTSSTRGRAIQTTSTLLYKIISKIPPADRVIEESSTRTQYLESSALSEQTTQPILHNKYKEIWKIIS